FLGTQLPETDCPRLQLLASLASSWMLCCSIEEQPLNLHPPVLPDPAAPACCQWRLLLLLPTIFLPMTVEKIAVKIL
ncbi:hypothetical protein DC007_14535, partial [Enterococcus faecalis]